MHQLVTVFPFAANVNIVSFIGSNTSLNQVMYPMVTVFPFVGSNTCLNQVMHPKKHMFVSNCASTGNCVSICSQC